MSRISIYLKFSKTIHAVPACYWYNFWRDYGIWRISKCEYSPNIVINIALGSLMASLLNGASNALNQIYDLEIDKINKPHRYLPSGKIYSTIKAWMGR